MSVAVRIACVLHLYLYKYLSVCMHSWHRYQPLSGANLEEHVLYTQFVFRWAHALYELKDKAVTFGRRLWVPVPHARIAVNCPWAEALQRGVNTMRKLLVISLQQEVISEGDGAVGALSQKQRLDRVPVLRDVIGIGRYLLDVVIPLWEDCPWGQLGISVTYVQQLFNCTRAYALWNAGCIKAREAEMKGQTLLHKMGLHFMRPGQSASAVSTASYANPSQAANPSLLPSPVASTENPEAASPLGIDDSISALQAVTLFYTAYVLMQQVSRTLHVRWGQHLEDEQHVPVTVDNLSATVLDMKCGGPLGTHTQLLVQNQAQSPNLKPVHWMQLCKVGILCVRFVQNSYIRMCVCAGTVASMVRQTLQLDGQEWAELSMF